jgi:hypothetical protein
MFSIRVLIFKLNFLGHAERVPQVAVVHYDLAHLLKWQPASPVGQVGFIPALRPRKDKDDLADAGRQRT